MTAEITAEKIRKSLSAKLLGREIYCYKIITSTNLAAKENRDFAEGCVFIAEEQTAGRGRLSRSWESSAGEGIYMSVLLKPAIAAGNLPCITLICGLAVCRALKKVGAEGVGIKWPNDIVIKGKKVCGVLTERTGGAVVAGIGVNVLNRGFGGELAAKATSLYLETGREYDRSELAAAILNELDSLYAEFLAKGFSPLCSEYERHCVTLGKNVRIITPAGEYTAEAEGIDEDGGLVIKRCGKTEIITSGEVSVRGIMGYM